MCDEYIRKLFVERNIHNEIRKLVLLALSAQTASDTYAMFFETYSPEDVEELKTKVSLIENIYGFSVTAQYEITEDEKEIADWENKKKVMEDFIKKNVNFFKNLPEGYGEILK